MHLSSISSIRPYTSSHLHTPLCQLSHPVTFSPRLAPLSPSCPLTRGSLSRSIYAISHVYPSHLYRLHPKPNLLIHILFILSTYPSEPFNFTPLLFLFHSTRLFVHIHSVFHPYTSTSQLALNSPRYSTRFYLTLPLHPAT